MLLYSDGEEEQDLRAQRQQKAPAAKVPNYFEELGGRGDHSDKSVDDDEGEYGNTFAEDQRVPRADSRGAYQGYGQSSRPYDDD
jgi:hypothetical protein